MARHSECPLAQEQGRATRSADRLFDVALGVGTYDHYDDCRVAPTAERMVTTDVRTEVPRQGGAEV